MKHVNECINSIHYGILHICRMTSPERFSFSHHAIGCKLFLTIDTLTKKRITNNWHIWRVQTSHAIATALNVIRTSHSFGDLMLVMKASQSRQVCISCLIFTPITIHLAYRCLLWSFCLFFKEQCWKVDDYR